MSRPDMQSEATTIAEQLKRAVTEFATHPALLSADGWLTFEQLGGIAQRATELLADNGARFGDRVVLYLENGAALRVLEHGILESGLVRVALSPRLHPHEVAAIAQDAGASIVCCAPELVEAVTTALSTSGSSARALGFSETGTNSPSSLAARRSTGPLGWADVEPSDVAMLMYSSGTTGVPKGAIVTHASWVAQTARALGQLPPIGPGDVVLATAPMTHFAGSIGLDCAVAGAATVPRAGFDPAAVLADIAHHAVTVLPLAPIMLTRLVDEMEAVSASADTRVSAPAVDSVRTIPYGGSRIPAQTLITAATHFAGAPVQFYGLAEALAPIACLSANDHDSAVRALSGDPEQRADAMSRLESAGRWVDGVDVTITEGQIFVRGDTVMPGYWNRDALTARVLDAEGWFATGDLATIDDNGFVHLTDRTSDVIISGGFNIYPGEVERVISTLPGIREVVVLGAASDRWGEGVHAVVVLDDSISEATSDDALLRLIVDACKLELASYKKPLAVRAVTRIPRNAAGKIDRNRLRAELWPARASQQQPPPS